MWSLNKILKGKSLDVFAFGHHVRPYGKIGRTFSKFGRTMSDDRLLFPALVFHLFKVIRKIGYAAPLCFAGCWVWFKIEARCGTL